MAELEYKVLERFSEAARREAASRVYDQPTVPKYGWSGMACQKGDCVMAVMLRADGFPLPEEEHTPDSTTIAKLLGLPVPREDDYDYNLEEEFPHILELDEIITANDRGHLQEIEAVRGLLLGEEETWQPASTPAASPSSVAP